MSVFGGVPLVDPERLRTKFGELETDLRDLTDKQGVTKREYLSDRDLQAIVERRFETSIQICLDVAGHIIASEGYREPSDYGDLFRILQEEGVLSATVADQMVEMAGFRNVLAHEYSDIDNERVYEHLQDIEHFRKFVQEITELLQDDQ